jgi:16S rRNA (adenine(1408)-N(1))-methyltransferase
MNSAAIDSVAIVAWAEMYECVVVDLGTGDGQFVRNLACRCPAVAVIGIDTCQGNVREVSRTAPDNLLFVVADAMALPDDLRVMAGRVTINFPWGSLLRGLLDGNAALLSGLLTVGGPKHEVTVRLNGGALVEAGYSFEEGGLQVSAVLQSAGYSVRAEHVLGPRQLRAYPTTWAKRLAFGRDPRAIQIEGVLAT